MMLKKIPLALGLLLILAGCISTSSEPEIVSTRILPSAVPIIAPSSYDVSEGQALYAQSCAPCHGAAGQGDGPAASGFTCLMPQLAQRPSASTMIEWYDIAYNGLRSSETCIMPPWNNTLSESQIWNVVAYAYGLKFSAGDSAAGQALLEALPGQFDPARLSDGAWQAETSDTALLRLATDNFSAEVSPEDQNDLFAHLRSQAYRQGQNLAAPVATEEVEVAQASTPAPLATAEAEPDPVSTPEALPGPVTTEEAAAPATTTPEASTPTAPLTVTGQLVMGSADSALPSGQVITLRVVGLNADGQPEEVYSAEATANPDGTFSFSDIPRQARTLGIAQTEYAGIRQFSEQFFPSTVQDETLPLTMTLYETTADSSAIQLQYVEFLVDAVREEAASLTYQTHEVINTGDRAYIGQEGRTLALRLPPGIISPQVVETGGQTERFSIELEGDHYVVYDSQPLAPNQLERITVAYGFSYEGSMTLTPTFNYPILEMNVFASSEHNLEVESTALTRNAPATLNNVVYQGYTLTNTPWPADQALTMRIFEAEPTFTREAEANQGFLRENTTLILGVGLLLVLAGGMFLVYDLQKTRLLAHTPAPSHHPTTQGHSNQRQALLAEIAALDEAYEAGQLSELDYQRQRGKLKADLAELS
jgi:mono/diheme cytochrome c family protein